MVSGLWERVVESKGGREVEETMEVGYVYGGDFPLPLPAVKFTHNSI